jgi:hypothetical protein
MMEMYRSVMRIKQCFCITKTPNEKALGVTNDIRVKRK